MHVKDHSFIETMDTLVPVCCFVVPWWSMNVVRTEERGGGSVLPLPVNKTLGSRLFHQFAVHVIWGNLLYYHRSHCQMPFYFRMTRRFQSEISAIASPQPSVGAGGTPILYLWDYPFKENQRTEDGSYFCANIYRTCSSLSPHKKEPKGVYNRSTPGSVQMKEREFRNLVLMNFTITVASTSLELSLRSTIPLISLCNTFGVICSCCCIHSFISVLRRR